MLIIFHAIMPYVMPRDDAALSPFCRCFFFTPLALEDCSIFAVSVAIAGAMLYCLRQFFTFSSMLPRCYDAIICRHDAAAMPMFLR